MWLVVDVSGKPRDIRVQHVLGMGLDEEAVEAVKRWRFHPSEKDGHPVPARIMVEVNFQLYPPAVPPKVEPHPASRAQPPQFPGVDTAKYPLVVRVGDVTGKHAGKGYVVSAEATIHEGGQQRKVIISCGPKGDCLLLDWGNYPARWLGGNDRMELLALKEPKGKWQKLQYSVVPAQSRGD
jgi:TonB family protein